MLQGIMASTLRESQFIKLSLADQTVGPQKWRGTGFKLNEDPEQGFNMRLASISVIVLWHFYPAWGCALDKNKRSRVCKMVDGYTYSCGDESKSQRI